MLTETRCSIVLDLFDRYYARVFGFARRSVDATTAEEIAQDVFERLLEHKDLEKKTLSASYLIKMTDNMLKRRYRRAERMKEIVGEIALERRREADPGSSATPDEQTRVTDAFERLSTQEQDAVRMIVCEGLSYEDAAASLGVRVSTINNWKYRGIQKLKQAATA